MLDSKFADGRTLRVKATAADGKKKSSRRKVRIDTPQEIEYYEHGGILQYVLRAAGREVAPALRQTALARHAIDEKTGVPPSPHLCFLRVGWVFC